MTKLKEIASKNELTDVLSKNELVVIKFTASWCGPCKAIAPLVDQLYSRVTNVEMVEVDVDKSPAVAKEYDITAMPTFVFLHNKAEVSRLRGANIEELNKQVTALSEKNPNATRATESASSASASSASTSGALAEVSKYVAKGYDVLNDVVHFGDAEILNVDAKDSSVIRKLLDASASNGGTVVSDADSQILAYIPFQNKVKVFSVLVKLAPKSDDEDKQRPTKISVWANTTGILSFEDASTGAKALHNGELGEPDENGWCEVRLRYVLFQNVSSIVLFFDGDDEDASTEIERVVLVGSKGESRDQPKIEALAQE